MWTYFRVNVRPEIVFFSLGASDDRVARFSTWSQPLTLRRIVWLSASDSRGRFHTSRGRGAATSGLGGCPLALPCPEKARRGDQCPRAEKSCAVEIIS